MEWANAFGLWSSMNQCDPGWEAAGCLSIVQGCSLFPPQSQGLWTGWDRHRPLPLLLGILCYLWKYSLQTTTPQEIGIKSSVWRWLSEKMHLFARLASANTTNWICAKTCIFKNVVLFHSLFREHHLRAVHATSQKSHPAFCQKPIAGKRRREREGKQ